MTMDDMNDTHANSPTSFGAIADQLSENIAAAAARMADATRDFTSLVSSLIDAGRELEKTMTIQRELGATSLKAVQDAQDAAAAAASSAQSARESEAASKEFTELTSKEYGSVSWLVQNLQQRIAALSVLASPLMAAPAQAGMPSSDAMEEPAADTNALADMEEYRAAS